MVVSESINRSRINKAKNKLFEALSYIVDVQISFLIDNN